MELRIKELAKEYKENRDAYMRVRTETKKKISAFEKWLSDVVHLKKNDIIAHEKEYFEFCNFCKEIIYFECRDFGLSWSFEIKCECDRTREKLESEMKNRIVKHQKRQRELDAKNMQGLF